MKKLVLVLMLSILGINVARAVVAYPYVADVQQSDGKVLSINMRGDERVSWAKTMDGYTLLRIASGDYVYAIPDNKGGMKASDIIAHNEQDRSEREKLFVETLDKNLFYSQEQLSIMKQYWNIKQDFIRKNKTYKLGNQIKEDYKMVVILMSFQDFTFTTSKQEVDDLFNQVGYSLNNHPGSVHDYFEATSNGILNLSATVVGPYLADSNMHHYGQQYTYPNGYTANDRYVRDLIEEAVKKSNNDVDYSEFTNGEGNYVSCVYVIYAGYAESQPGNSTDCIWPHRSHLLEKLPVDGVYVYDYGCSSEFNGNPNHTEPLTIGTICHEFSHVLGQPDYYDTDYSDHGNAPHPDSWDLMASGNYNGDGRFPPLWSAMERTVRNYVDLEEVKLNSNITIPYLGDENKAYKLSYTNTSEYFILENRQQKAWDTYLPGHGMMIYRVDSTVWGWNSNCVNCDTSSLGYQVVPANNNGWNYGGHPFPGTSHKYSFTDTSTPSSLSKQGYSLNKPLYRINENTSTGNITFYCGDTTNIPNITNFTLTFRNDSLDANSVISNASNIVEKGYFYTKNSLKVDSLSSKAISNSLTNEINFTFIDLDNDTYYYIRPYVKTSSKYIYGEIIKIQTPCIAVSDFPYIISFEDNQANCWQQEGTTYIHNKWKYVDSTGVANAVEGANNGEKFAFIHTDGTNSQVVKLISTPMDLSLLDKPILKYWHHQKVNGNKQDILKVYYKKSMSDEWQLLTTHSNNINNWKKDSIELPNKSKTYFIAFESTVKNGFGIGLDDIEITDKTIASWPTVITENIYNITDKRATFKANVISSGYTTLQEKGFVISQNSMPEIDNAEQILQLQNTTLGQYELTTQNLEPSTTYYIRAYAKNEGLTAYGNQIEFTTLCDKIKNFPYEPNLSSEDTNCFYVQDSKLILPILDLSNKDNMSITYTAIRNTDDATIHSVQIYYRNDIDGSWELLNSTTEPNNQTITIDIPTATHQNENSYIAFTGLGLTNEDYYILTSLKINAISQIPFVTTDTVYLSAYNQITVDGTVTYAGMSNVSSKGICYSKNENPTVTDNIVVSNSNSDNFTVTATNLDSLSTYYIRTFATNSYGTAYGEQRQITTPFTPIFNNIIEGDQRLCSGGIPSQINGSSPFGGNGSYSFLWISSTDSINWAECSEGTLTESPWYEPGMRTITTYYRRIVTSYTSIDTSNTVTVRIDPQSRGGNVFKITDTVEVNQPLRVELRAYTGKILYWERLRPGYDWMQVENSTDSIFLTDYSQIVGNHSYRAVVKSGDCQQVTSGINDVYVKNAIGLNTIKNDFNIKLSPNPTRDVVSINIVNDLGYTDVIITNMEGKVVKFDKVNLIKGSNKIDLQSLSNGTYLIYIINNDIYWTDKIIINK